MGFYQNFTMHNAQKWHDRSTAINERWQYFQKKVVLTILPPFLTNHFQLKFSKLCQIKHRTKNRSYLADSKYVPEGSTATTEPDMTFLFVYFGLKHPVLLYPNAYPDFKKLRKIFKSICGNIKTLATHLRKALVEPQK